MPANRCQDCNKQIGAKSARCRACNMRGVYKFSPVSKPLGDRAMTDAEKSARWRAANPTRAKQAQSRHRASMRERVAKCKADRGCEDCGIVDHRLLDLHHRDGEEKVGAVSKLQCHSSWAAVRAEMEKCRVLCANCHRIEHAEELSAITAQFNAAGFFRAS